MTELLIGASYARRALKGRAASRRRELPERVTILQLHRMDRTATVRTAGGAKGQMDFTTLRRDYSPEAA